MSRTIWTNRLDNFTLPAYSFIEDMPIQSLLLGFDEIPFEIGIIEIFQYTEYKYDAFPPLVVRIINPKSLICGKEGVLPYESSFSGYGDAYAVSSFTNSYHYRHNDFHRHSYYRPPDYNKYYQVFYNGSDINRDYYYWIKVSSQEDKIGFLKSEHIKGERLLFRNMMRINYIFYIYADKRALLELKQRDFKGKCVYGSIFTLIIILGLVFFCSIYSFIKSSERFDRDPKLEDLKTPYEI